MIRSRDKPLTLFIAILFSAVLMFMLALGPVYGKGGGGGGGGHPSGGGGGHPSGGGGGFHGPSMSGGHPPSMSGGRSFGAGASGGRSFGRPPSMPPGRSMGTMPRPTRPPSGLYGGHSYTPPMGGYHPRTGPMGPSGAASPGTHYTPPRMTGPPSSFGRGTAPYTGRPPSISGGTVGHGPSGALGPGHTTAPPSISGARQPTGRGGHPPTGATAPPPAAPGHGPSYSAPGAQGHGPRSPGQVPGATYGIGTPEHGGGHRGAPGAPGQPGQPGHGQRPPGQGPGQQGHGQPGYGQHPPGQPGHEQPGHGQPGHGQGPGYGLGNEQGHHENDHYHHPYHSGGYYYYPGFYGGFFYGFWAFGGPDYCYTPYCYTSPFYYYGFPYVYAPRVEVVQVPAYTYTPLPYYEYNNGYYLSQGYYTGLDAAINDIQTAWTSGNPNLILQHIDGNTQIAIYLNGNYSYSLAGTDYANMVRDAITHIRTVSFTITNMEMRSDGAYTVTGRHEFYDINNNLRSVNISYTLAPVNGVWVIVAAGSAEGG